MQISTHVPLQMILVALALVAIASAAPADKVPEIIQFNNEQQPDGAYQFR